MSASGLEEKARTIIGSSAVATVSLVRFDPIASNLSFEKMLRLQEEYPGKDRRAEILCLVDETQLGTKDLYMPEDGNPEVIAGRRGDLKLYYKDGSQPDHMSRRHLKIRAGYDNHGPLIEVIAGNAAYLCGKPLQEKKPEIWTPEWDIQLGPPIVPFYAEGRVAMSGSPLVFSVRYKLTEYGKNIGLEKNPVERTIERSRS